MHRYAALLALLAVVTLGLVGAAGAGDESSFEVWAVDQSNTTGTTSGGAIHIYDGDALNGADAANARSERIDLGAAATSLCLAHTGTAPVRPHMLFFNTGQSHAILAFVATGHVLFLNAAERTPLACIDVGAQAHAAVPSPDEAYVVVANQNGKLLQRIRPTTRRTRSRLSLRRRSTSRTESRPRGRSARIPRSGRTTRRSARSSTRRAG